MTTKYYIMQKFLFLILILFSFILIIGCSTTKSTTVVQPDFPKKFSISGNKIVDENSNEFVFRGVNILDPAWLEDDSYNHLTDSYFANIASWEANIIRIPIHPAGYTYYGSTAYLALIDKVLTFAEKYKLYAIIDFHSIGFPPDSTVYKVQSDSSVPWGSSIYDYSDTMLKNFWADIANRYKNDDRVVFYEIFNEPTYRTGSSDAVSWLAWKSKAEEIISIIRAYDTDSKIIVNGISWAYDLSYVKDNPISYSSIVYGTHPYPQKSKSYDDAFGNLKATYPVFATEFGFDPNATGENYQADTTYGDEMITYLENKKISWTVWHFSPVWEPALISDWNSTYATTTSGSLFKNYMKALN